MLVTTIIDFNMFIVPTFKYLVYDNYISIGLSTDVAVQCCAQSRKTICVLSRVSEVLSMKQMPDRYLFRFRIFRPNLATLQNACISQVRSY